MFLQRCTLSWQAFTTCASHAMSTEKQEVMGLLLGRWHVSPDGNTNSPPTVTVDHAMILTRTDKREDRVEVGYKQLAEASSIAERMSAQLGQDTRVVGWYHSHPHITVLPSHVDVRTQGQYQSMDKRFIGLIFSVFNEDKLSKVGTIEVTAFQARDTSEVLDIDAGNGGGPGRGRGGGGSGSGGMGGGPSTWERTEVALALHSPGPGSSTTPLSDALERVVRLQDTLFGEERAGYLSALNQNEAMVGQEESSGQAQGGAAAEDRKSRGVDLLSKLFCSAVYSKSLAALTGDSAVPLAQTLRSQLNILKRRAAALERRGSELRSKLLPEELQEAAAQVDTRLRNPCSAGIGAFQAHEGEQDIPRADALQFGRQGGPLRRARLFRASNTLVHFKVFREYPTRPGATAAAAPLSTDTAALTPAPPESRPALEPTRQGSGGGGGGSGGGGVWVVDVAGKRQTLVGLRADVSRQWGLLFLTKEDGEMEVACEDQESYRMWLGVAAAVCPTAAAAAGSIE